MNEPIKLLMTWDIKPGQEETYFSFITQDFPLALRQVGLQLTDAWYTVYGDWPQVRMGFVAANVAEIERFLSSQAWDELKKELFKYVHNYYEKIVPAQGNFQI